MNSYRITRSGRKSGFTLIEILIVVIILGILAAIVIPQFTNASTSARQNSLTSQLQTVRSQIELYRMQHNDALPDLVTDWSQMTGQTDVSGAAYVSGTSTTGPFGPYLQQAPTNPLNNKSLVKAAAEAGVGWVYDATTGAIHGTTTDQTAATTD
jgi:general secretion pathway protein G